MNPLFADVVGIAGGASIVGAYLYNNVAARVNALIYNLVNLLGALLLCVSLTVHYNLASLLLEIVWIGVALFGIGKALKGRSQA